MTMTDVGPDDGTGLLRVMANLNVTLGSMHDEAQEQRKTLGRMLDARRAETPRRARFHGTGTPGASGLVVVGFDNQPSLGRYWNVRKMTVGGLTPDTTAAGQAHVYVTAVDLRMYGTLAAMGSADWLDTAAVLPLAADFSPGELPVVAPEKLWLVITGGTNGQQYTCQGVADDIMESAVTTDWTV